MIEQMTVFLFTAGLIMGAWAICQQVANWAMRTPRSGYLLLIVFALFIQTRSMH